MRVRGKAQEAAVHAPVEHPLLDLQVVAQQKLVVDVGVILLELAHDGRQPVGRHAGERPDADEAGLHAVELLDEGFEAALLGAHAPHLVDEALAFGGEMHAGAAARQQAHAPGAFELADHAADPRLRVGQRFGGAGEAAQLRGFHERLVTLKRMHGLTSLYDDFAS